MKILLDECIDWRLKYDFTELEASSVKDEGWLGKKNGELLLLASQSGFDVFLTIDKKLQFQQNIGNHPLTIEYLIPLLAQESISKNLYQISFFGYPT